jgi:carbon-monoxide dehydrogenase large subunit
VPRLTPAQRPRLLAGQGGFIADVELPGALDVAFVRSPFAHAAVGRVSGPDACVTAADLGLHPLRIEGRGLHPVPWHPLATDRVRYAGEAVAACWAADRYLAEDLAEQVEVDYRPLEDSSPLHAEAPDGLLFEHSTESGDVDALLATAAVVLERTYRTARVTPLPLECRGVLADYDAERETWTVWTSTQVPTLVQRGIASCLGVAPERVRVLVPDVGGGFGLKAHLFAEEVVLAALARRLRRPVRWLEDRLENLTAAAHAHDDVLRLRVGASAEGRLLALDVEVTADVGAYSIYPFSASLEPTTSAASVLGPYDLAAYRSRVRAVASARCPVGAYRGVGIAPGVHAGERLLDELAAELGQDPLQLRRQNAIRELPRTTAAGRRLDAGDYPRLLDTLEERAGYGELRRWQAEARAQGRLVGVGVALFNEHAGTGSRGYLARGIGTVPGTDACRVLVTEAGRIEIRTSAAEAGQGHADTYRALAARELGVDPDLVDVLEGDTELCPEGTGTFTSRGSVSVVQAVAAALREAAAADLAPGTDVTCVNDPDPLFSSGAHLALVEVLRPGFIPRVLRYVAVEDCGAVLHEEVVLGQVQGGVAMGLGDVLLSEQVYSAEGQNLTSTLLDYLVPLAPDVPAVEVHHLGIPTPANSLGSKGVGEAGTIGAYGAIPNAVADALRPLGAELDRLPYTPDRIRAAVARALPEEEGVEADD